jgi:hypothetical protein
MSNIINTVGGSWTTGITSTSISTIFGPGGLSAQIYPSLTPEEQKELETLEQEHRSFIKVNRIKKFQNLPKHIRQEIVDEAYIRDLTQSLASDDDKDFEHLQKLQSLRSKNSYNNGYATVTSIGGLMHQEYNYSGKYHNIIRHFVTEEIAQAHAQSCLEEALETNTDSK